LIGRAKPRRQLAPGTTVLVTNPARSGCIQLRKGGVLDTACAQTPAFSPGCIGLQGTRRRLEPGLHHTPTSRAGFHPIIDD
jgi:hypothetical protein